MQELVTQNNKREKLVECMPTIYLLNIYFFSEGLALNKIISLYILILN